MAQGGYAWWYVDALSEDGQFGITLIAFVGSVFSPYYALARRRGTDDPENHCALNVALYGPRASRWAMTERGRGRIHRTISSFAIGPSSIAWDGDALTFVIDEVAVPFPSRIRGTVRVTPAALAARSFTIDGEGRHRWWPFAPTAHAEVSLSHPGLRWRGRAYCDSNFGNEPLEAAFRRWHWSRAALREGTVVLYDTEPRRAAPLSLALRFEGAGNVAPFAPPPRAALASTFWRIPREMRSEAGSLPQVRQTLEDAPFYARSLVTARLCGEPVTAMHESLCLDRFAYPLVQMMLPFRMPRRR